MLPSYSTIRLLSGSWDNPFPVDDSQLEGKIKRFRLEPGISKKRLAKLIGVDPATITRLEEGRCTAKSLQKALEYVTKENR